MIKRGLIAALVLSAGVATAHEHPPDGKERGRAREEIFRMLDEYIADNLQAKVELTDEQFGKALPLVRRLHADRRRFAARRIRALHQMKKAAEAGVVSDARATELLHELKAAESEEATAVRAGQDAVDAVLTPTQQLKYRLLETKIEHRLRELMNRVRSQRRDGRGRGDDLPRESPAPR